jgi:Protein of unknown function (DUF3238)
LAEDGSPSRVKLWLKAFIPGDAPGTIDGVGASSGHRVLQGPVGWFNDCFWTDTRGFSSSIGASCRMHSECVLDLSTGAGSGWVHYCGETHECDCEDGDIECSATASTSRMHWTEPWWHADGVLAIHLSGAANNPCFGGSPDIDYEGTYYIDVNQRQLTFQGKVNGFPAYESYAEFDGSTVTVFNYGPTGVPDDLMGAASESIDETVSF